jgi:hypothetical protein
MHRMIAQALCRLAEHFVVGRDHATLTSRDNFVAIKTEYPASTERPNPLTPVLGPMRLGRILNDN